MIVLGIESSTDQLSIGLSDGTRVISDLSDGSTREHTTIIIGLIDRLLCEAGIGMEQMKGIAVSIGPGSFTGLRVGLAVAKGMSLSLNLPIAGVSTFEVIGSRLIATLPEFYLAAVVRRGEYYLVKFPLEDEIRSAICTTPLTDLANHLAGSPVGLIGRRPEEWTALQLKEIEPEHLVVSGGELALHGSRRLTSAGGEDVATLEPLYIVPSQAERKHGI